MDKKQLDSILKNAYNLPLWRQVLTEVFGARNLNQKPQPILLPSNDLAKEALELGFFNTTDDRIIGIYQIDLKDKVKIERNKVGLRELLRSVYKYDVDGALVVFVQSDKWRLSFVSEIRVLNDDGTIDTKATEPKRYTYLLGKGEKTKTPTDRLALLANKKIALEDIRQAFSVEALNNEFYKQISEYFYQLVGATTTKGKKTEVRPKTMKLPGVADDDRKTYQEFAVRLIGRTVFCWFLREKKSEQNKPLLPEKLLSSNAVGDNKNYYHEILEPLFFQTLNTPMNERIEDLPKGCEIVPFLNGGLFEPQIEDFYNAESKTGSFQNYALKIPDSWFAEFFQKLEEYNFTIDENSPTEVEISVDPEMLGRIFENLLAEIDPDSGETARKATGSFYTPREIVNYMVDESLLIYLKSKLQAETVGYQSLKSPQTTFGGNDWRVGQPHLEYPLNENRWQGKDEELERTLRELFSYSDNENPFDDSDTKRLIKAIDECKILDPACGSGAFPIGVLQRLVYLLGKLDKKSSKWKRAQLDKIDQLIENAKEIDDANIRSKVTGDLQTRKNEIEKDFANKELDFGRKLFLIENCIYGVDIQPIAAEISKLRCFLTLIVDDTIDEAKPNRGVNPLPNLEFKFVTADALLKLPASGLFQATTEKQMSELEQIRHEYINSYGAGKESAKARFKQIQDEIFDAQIKNNRENPDKRAIALSTWNPFGHEKVDWFDALWMFGVKGFDIVIGNPPYLRVQGISPSIKKAYQDEFESATGAFDLYVLFTEKGFNLLSENGIVNYIMPDKWVNGGLGKGLRKVVSNYIQRLVSFKQYQVFNASTYSSLLWINKKKQKQLLYGELDRNLPNNQDLQKWLDNLSENDFAKNENAKLTEDAWTLTKPEAAQILRKMASHSRKLKDVFEKVFQGIATSADNIYFLYDCKKVNGIVTGYSKALEENISVESGLVKPLLKGDNVHRYEKLAVKSYIVFPYNVEVKDDLNSVEIMTEKNIKSNFPLGWNYLKSCKNELKERERGRFDNNEWFQFSRNQGIRFEKKPKLFCRDICQKSQFTFDETGKFYTTTTVYGYIKFRHIKEDYKFFLAILNSQLTWYFMQNTAAVLANGYYRYMPRYTLELPIPTAPEANQKPFENLVDYILFLKETDAEQVNEYVPNSHLVEQFEEVIDALVYELYFEEDFRTAEIEFLKYAARDFPPIENLARPDKIKTVHAAYQRLRQKDNEIRNNLKLMDIRLADLIMPIKTAR